MSDCCSDATLSQLAPTPLEIEIMQGDTLEVGFLVRTVPVAPATVGAIADLTGCVVDFAMTNVATRAVVAMTTTIADVLGAGGKHGTAKILCATAGRFEVDGHVRDQALAERTFARADVRVIRRR